MYIQLSEQDWIQLPMADRLKLIDIFKIPQSAYSHVSDGKVITDGHTFSDLAAISVETMKKYTGSDSDNFVFLFDLTLRSIHGEVVKEINAHEETKQETSSEATKPGGADEGHQPSNGGAEKAGTGKEPVVSPSSRNQQVNRGR